MDHSGKIIEARSAKETLELFLQTWEYYFPPSMRARFEQCAAAFEMRDQVYWIDRAKTKTPQIAEALRKLGEWADIPDSELLMSSWDDEVFFFYVLRTQFLVARLAAKPNDMVPGHFDAFWKWAMTLSKDEPWMLFPVMTKDALKTAPFKPPIWRIPYPIDYPE